MANKQSKSFSFAPEELSVLNAYRLMHEKKTAKKKSKRFKDKETDEESLKTDNKMGYGAKKHSKSMSKVDENVLNEDTEVVVTLPVVIPMDNFNELDRIRVILNNLGGLEAYQKFKVFKYDGHNNQHGEEYWAVVYSGQKPYDDEIDTLINNYYKLSR